MENREIAKILRETANLLELDGAQIGRYRSYEKSAQVIESLSERIEDIARDPAGDLTALPAIGDRMAEHIREIVSTGGYKLHRQLLKKYPPTILEVLSLQGLGPKKVAVLWKTFRAGAVADVENLAREGKLRDLAGFGEKTEQNILKAVEVHKRSAGRFHIHVADGTAASLVDYMERLGNRVESITPAGSLRRGKETIGDLDLLLISENGEAVSEHILKYPEIDQVLAHGENKVSFRLRNTLQVDVRILDKKNFGAALMYFTGSKEHNIALRGLANKLGYTLNEYGLSTLKGNRIVASHTEEEIYHRLGLHYIEPELRENNGEIEAALKNKLPSLVALNDIRGDLQMHTTASDGKNSIEEMAQAARRLGYKYIALTDHSKAVTVANGLDEKRTLQQIKKIREAQKRTNGIRLLAGMEVDINKDGSLDLDDEVLAQLDVVVCSVHSYMKMESSAMTDRLLRAMANKRLQILAHPTGRLLLRRDPFPFDIEKVLDEAKKRGVVMELNAFPDRLDLKDIHLRMAKERGVKIVISTDAHATTHLEWMRYGVKMARRGWLEKKDVLNTLPLEKMMAELRGSRP